MAPAQGSSTVILALLCSCGGSVSTGHDAALVRRQQTTRRTPLPAPWPTQRRAASASILASNYDRSCSVDSDCTKQAGSFAIVNANYCVNGCLCPVGTDAINISAVPQYIKDCLNDAAGIRNSFPPLPCSCPFYEVPVCCRDGMCTTSPVCFEAPGGGETDGGAHDAEVILDGSTPCSLTMGPVEETSSLDTAVHGAVPRSLASCSMVGGPVVKSEPSASVEVLLQSKTNRPSGGQGIRYLLVPRRPSSSSTTA